MSLYFFALLCLFTLQANKNGDHPSREQIVKDGLAPAGLDNWICWNTMDYTAGERDGEAAMVANMRQPV